MCRAYNNCCSWLAFDVKITRLKAYFANNGYPLHIFDYIVKRFSFFFFNDKFTHRVTALDTDKQIIYVTLPFQEHASYQVKNNLQLFCRKKFLKVIVKFVLTNSHTIGNYFRFKDSLPDLLSSDVVYSYNSLDCRVRYIGSTTGTLE